MTPITATIEGRSYALALTADELNGVLDTKALYLSFKSVSPPGDLDPSEIASDPSFPNQARWAQTFLDTPSGSTPNIEPSVIRAVLAAALVGGGADLSDTAENIADRLHRGGLNGSVDRLVAQVVQAAIAAG